MKLVNGPMISRKMDFDRDRLLRYYTVRFSYCIYPAPVFLIRRLPVSTPEGLDFFPSMELIYFAQLPLLPPLSFLSLHPPSFLHFSLLQEIFVNFLLFTSYSPFIYLLSF